MIKSMFSGVAGLRAHQTQMDVIGNNIANVNTNGFKSSRTVFRDAYYRTLNGAAAASNISGGSNPSQIGIGSQVSTVDVVNTNGGPITTGRSLDAYINGEGYFAVMDGAGNQMYSRLGRFDFDNNGNLVDGNRYYVMGYQPKEPQYMSYVGGASIDMGGVDANPAKGIANGNSNVYFKDYKIRVVYQDAGAAEAAKATYDHNTKEILVQYTPKAGTAPAPDSVMNAAMLQGALRGDTAVTGVTAPVQVGDMKDNNGNVLTIAAGASTNPPAANTVYLGDITVTKNATKDEIRDDNGTVSKVTLCDTTQAPSKITYSDLSGVTGISVDASGMITGTKGKEIIVLGQVAIATFPNPNGLNASGNSYFSTSNNSGEVTFNAPGQNSAGGITPSSLEGSNVDLANEFSTMILTQRGFQANSKIITVSDTMLEELINLKR